MDTVPYDFISRVCTKLKKSDIEFLQIECSIWTEVCRVHKEKRRDFTIAIYVPPHGKTATIKIYGLHDQDNYTLAECRGFDQRFIRVKSLTIGTRDELDILEYLSDDDYQPFQVDELPELLKWTSFSTLDWLSLYFNKQDFMDECVRNELTTSHLVIQHCPETIEFLKRQLKSTELRKLFVLHSFPLEFRKDIIAFVCRPEFQYLKCDYNSFGVDCLKKIVAYWRAMEAPWESANIDLIVTYKSYILDDELASCLDSLPPQRDRFCSKFQELNGQFSLDVQNLCGTNVAIRFGNVLVPDDSGLAFLFN